MGDRALNGIEVPVFFQGEQVSAYRKYDERLTVALLGKLTMGGNPSLGRLGPGAERDARDFEGLLARLEAGEAVETGARAVDEPSELDMLRRFVAGEPDKGEVPCPSAYSDEELLAALQEVESEYDSDGEGDAV